MYLHMSGLINQLLKQVMPVFEQYSSKLAFIHNQ